jgi:hypothetical protein
VATLEVIQATRLHLAPHSGGSAECSRTRTSGATTHTATFRTRCIADRVRAGSPT